MTKLDEAHRAAWEAFDASEGDMEQAIQAAVKVLVPDDQLYDDVVADGIFPAPTLLAIGWNNCRAQTLKNAGVE